VLEPTLGCVLLHPSSLASPGLRATALCMMPCKIS